MTGWALKPLLDAADLVTTRVGAFGDARQYVSTGDVDGTVIVRSEPVTFEGRPLRADLSAAEGDVLFARMQATDKVVVVTNETKGNLWSTGFATLRPRPHTHPRWLSFWLQSKPFIERKDALCTGATQKAITNDGIRKLTIPLPPPAEQERIVRILDEAEALRRLRSEADHRMPAVSQALFGQLLARNDGDWRKARLEDLCSAVEDCPHSTPGYCEAKTAYPCVRSSDIQEGRFDWSTTKYVDEAEYNDRVRRLIPQCGDVVYCREGARLGNAAIIPNGVTLCLGQRMMLFRPAPGIVTAELIWALLHSGPIRQQVQALVGGAASPHLNVRDIKAFSVAVPPYGLQIEFASHVQEIRALEAAQATSRQRLGDLFQSVLDRAFQGEL